MIVIKFGGTSLANAERIQNVANIIKTRLNKNPIVVISAIAGITDILINTAKESAKGINPDYEFNQIKNKHKEIISLLNLNENLLDEDFDRLYKTLNGVYLLKELS